MIVDYIFDNVEHGDNIHNSCNVFFSITSFNDSEIETARTFAHEVGHTVGME